MSISQLFKNCILLGIGVTLMACSRSYNNGKTINDAAPLEAPKVKCQLNWVGHWKNEGEKGMLVREIANEYEFLHQNIKVNLKFPEDIYGAYDSAEIKFVVGQVKKPVADWDIIRLFGYYGDIGNGLKDPDWMAHDLVDFSKVPGFMEAHKAFIYNRIYQNEFDHRFYGPYNECQLAALYVNKNVAKKMGISVKQFDMTFSDFLGYIKAADEYNKSHSYIMPIFEYDWVKTRMIFKILFFSLLDNTEEALDPKLTPEKLSAIYKSLQAMEELSKYHPIEKDWSNHKWINENEKVLRDSCLFFPNFTFMYNIWEMHDKKDLSNVIPCEFPVFRPSKIYIGGYKSNWAVLKNAPHKEEAIKLLMYWCQPQVAEEWSRISKSPSGVKGNLTASSFGTDVFDNYSYMMSKKYGNYLITDEADEYVVGMKNKGISLRIDDILEGKVTAKQVFEDFKRKAILD